MTIQKEYLSVSELADYSGISQRTLRVLLIDPLNPIPHFRVGSAGRIIKIKRSEFDEWMQSQRAGLEDGIDNLIKEVLN